MDTQLDTTANEFDTSGEREVAGPVDGSNIEVPFFNTVGPKEDSSKITGQLKSGFDTAVANILDIMDLLKQAA